MLILHDLDELNIGKNTAVTIGKFDGLHPGHRELIGKAVEKKKEGLLAAVLMLVSSSPDSESILTEEETEKILEESGTDIFLRLPLTEERMNMEAREFVEKILIGKLRMSSLICGTDFCFGKGRKGDIGLLSEMAESLGFSLTVVPKLRKNGAEISSSLIREKMREGKIESANDLLGYDYTISGEIVHGRALGRTIGFPTINILPGKGKLLPLSGVYFAEVLIDGEKFDSVLNIGTKPTVTEDQIKILEAHLLNFSGDVYNRTASVRFLRFIRPEKKFGGLEELKKQIREDLLKAEKMAVCEHSVNTDKIY